MHPSWSSERWKGHSDLNNAVDEVILVTKLRRVPPVLCRLTESRIHVLKKYAELYQAWAW